MFYRFLVGLFLALFFMPSYIIAEGIDISGEIISFYGIRKEKSPFHRVDPSDLKSAKTAKHGLMNNAALNFKYEKEQEKFKYGAFIRLHANTSAASNSEETVADKIYIWAQNNNIGRVEIGSIYGVVGMLRVDTMGFAKAGYGVEGFNSLLHSSQTLKYPSLRSITAREFVTQPHLPSNFSGHHYADANKINLYTQPLTNLTVGVSYIPDLDFVGTSAAFNNGKDKGPNDKSRKNHIGTFRNIISTAIQYKFDVNDYQVKLLAAGEIGAAKKVKTESGLYERVLRDLKAAEIGAAIDYKGWHFGAVYGNWFKSGTYIKPFENTKQGAHYTSYEISQEVGDFAWSLTYMMSKRAGGIESLNATYNRMVYEESGGAITGATSRARDLYVSANPIKNSVDESYNKYWNISLGAEYKLAPGLLPFAEVSMFDYTESGVYKSNRGYIYIIGTKLIF